MSDRLASASFRLKNAQVAMLHYVLYCTHTTMKRRRMCVSPTGYWRCIADPNCNICCGETDYIIQPVAHDWVVELLCLFNLEATEYTNGWHYGFELAKKMMVYKDECSMYVDKLNKSVAGLIEKGLKD